MMERYKDIVGGVLWLGVALVMYAASFEMKTLVIGAASSSFVGSGFMPRLVAVLMAFFSALIIWRGFRNLRLSPVSKAGDKINWLPEYLPVAVSVGLLVLYIVLMEKVGFLIMTIIYLFGQMLILSAPDHRRPVMFLIISVLGAVGIYYTFTEVFMLMLPESRLF